MFQSSKEPPIVLSIGGSLIVPGEIDADFLSRLNAFIREHVKKGRRFFLVTGGGKTARKYRDAGKAVIGTMTDDDLDWLGIHATRLNAHLLRTIFEDIAHPRIIENYDRRLRDWEEPVVIGSGWKPGWSTDYDAVVLARDYGANLVMNLSNIEYVYDKDPRAYPDARPIEKMTWEEMENLLPTEWAPGINAPFDPVAAQLAKSLKLTVIVTNDNFDNLNKILEGEHFKGTVITPYRIDASYYNRDYYTSKTCGLKIAPPQSFLGNIFQNMVNMYRALTIKFFLNPQTCLDVGCGTGRLVKSLRSLGVDAYGVDVSEHAIELADDSVKPFLKVGSVTEIPYEDNSFDAVVSFDVLEHMERGTIRQSVNESIRVSRKHILHKVYTKENNWITWFHGHDHSHVSVFTKKFWQKMFLEHSGVTLLKAAYFKLPSFFESVFVLRKK